MGAERKPAVEKVKTSFDERTQSATPFETTEPAERVSREPQVVTPEEPAVEVEVEEEVKTTSKKKKKSVK